MKKIPQLKHLTCMICDHTYQPEEVEYVCPKHGDHGTLDVVYDYEVVQQLFEQNPLATQSNHSIWRYRPLLPIHGQVPEGFLQVGNTPLYRTNRLAKHLGLKHVWVKDDGRQATASLKDRAAAIAIIKAQEQQTEVITTASTGNAAAALSGLCASIGQKNVIFVPKNAPKAKIAQLLAFGSEVFLVDGSYDDAFELCLKASATFGWYNRNTGYNPYMTEGKKTVSFEIYEQLQNSIPDTVLVSVGDGCIIGGVHKGFKDLKALGWITKIPKIIGVQAEGSNYLAEAWKKNENLVEKPAINAHTVADSISAGLPRDRFKAMAAVRETNGAFITVSDQEILNAMPVLAKFTGVFGEPAGATALAGLQKLCNFGQIDTDEKVVIINTGNGLKDINAAEKSLQLNDISPRLISKDIVFDATKSLC